MTIEATIDINKLNQAIQQFPAVYPITAEMQLTFTGISRMIMLDRYAYKDVNGETLAVGDLVILTTNPDPKYPTKGLGIIQAITADQLTIEVTPDYRSGLTDPQQAATGIVTRDRLAVEKPLELFYEQIAKRVATEMASREAHPAEMQQTFYELLINQDLIPAGRVLYGAGSHSQATYFNCYVMPMIADSREGLAKHRQEVMEIMSRGGGVGTNGSTLRPKDTLVRGVNGKSSGAVSWLNDLANLTQLVQQGGSRRGAQMIMLADWHPDIFEFILSKMQNPDVLRKIQAENTNPVVKQLIAEKLVFTPLAPADREYTEYVLAHKLDLPAAQKQQLQQKLALNGHYEVRDTEFLSGANISVCITKEFMDAVISDGPYDLRFPDVAHYDQAEMQVYNEQWQACGDVREWSAQGHAVHTYQTIQARELWDLITTCATYSAEPGIFFIDNANAMTNATAYGQKVVATNPCGEQPLTPYSVCNLAAINLANMVNKTTQTVDFDKLAKTVKNSIRFQDNVIDATPYFFDKNEYQAKHERRIGLGVMGLADLLIYCGQKYGSSQGNRLIDQVFEQIALTAYQTSVALAKEKGSFPFLIGETAAQTQALRQRFIETGYMQKMPASLKADILKYGIRNSHLLTVAPTGSTGTMVGVSTGLEPYFSFSYFRSGRLGKFIEVNAQIVDEYLTQHPEADAKHLPDYFVSAMALSPEAHVSVQCTIQRWVDSSISKTVNAPRGYRVDQVSDIYKALYFGGAKGGTVYVDGSRDSQVLILKSEDQANVATTEESTTTLPVVDEKDPLAIGNPCPICKKGTIQEIGGCSTCTNCKIQLKCGL